MSKTRMTGPYNDYLEMFEQIMFWNAAQHKVEKYNNEKYKPQDIKNCGYLYGLGWAISDMYYHGWQGEAAKNEQDIYDKVETAYCYLLKTLAEAIDFEDIDNDIWKSDLKYIDTNDLLELHKKNNDKRKKESNA